MIPVRVTRLKANAEVPQYMTAGASGCDIKACLEHPMEIPPMGRAAIPTGLAMAIPPGYEIQVRPRSGLSIKQGLTVVNAPGTIDSDFRGELMILMVNLSDRPVIIGHGDRVAQLIIQKVEHVSWKEVAELDDTDRGIGGFGSTGVREPVNA